MSGYLTAITVWSLAAAPLVFVACRIPRNVYLGIAGTIGIVAVTAWLAMAGYGYCITENMTTSLSGHVYLHKKGEPFQKGDLVAYRWHGGAAYPAGTTFIKRVVGVPGDVVKRDGSEFWVEDRYIGRAKPTSRTGLPLTPAAGGVIPEGEYFVATPSADSLDSRYALSGNVKQIEIIGKAYEIF